MAQTIPSELRSIPPETEPSLAVKIFASGLGSGYSPVASGTAGSLVGLAIYALPGIEHPFFFFPLIIVTFLAGVYSSAKMEKRFGKDPGIVTIDEVVGMWIGLLFLPKTVILSIACFFLFRLFDIIKPWPANVFDKRNGGFAIMVDDLFAGLYANIVLQIAVILYTILT